MKQSQLLQKPNLAFNCSEDWNKMSPCEQGRFCGSCRKTVVDFTQKSDAEIQDMLALQTGKVCGRFYAQQLAVPASNGFSLRSALGSVLMLLGLNFLSKEATAQQQQKLPGKVPAKEIPSDRVYKIGKVREQPKAKSNVSPKKSTVRPMPHDILTGEVIVDPGFRTATPVSNANLLKPKTEPEKGEYYQAPEPPEIYTFVEKYPEYKYGGEAGLKKFLDANKRATEDKTEGLVVLSFIVDTVGQVSEITVLKSLSAGCDKEAIRLAKLLEFEPGRMNGKKVFVRYNWPVRFRNL